MYNNDFKHLIEIFENKYRPPQMVTYLSPPQKIITNTATGLP